MVMLRTTQGPASPVPEERWAWNPEALCLEHLPSSRSTQVTGLNPTLEMREEGPPSLFPSEASPLFSSCVWPAALHSTKHGQPHLSALKSRGRADCPVETLGGGAVRGSPGLGGFHGRDRRGCLGIIRVGCPGQDTAPWAGMSGLLWAVWLYG